MRVAELSRYHACVCVCVSVGLKFRAVDQVTKGCGGSMRITVQFSFYPNTEEGKY